jgi:MFS family permease
MNVTTPGRRNVLLLGFVSLINDTSSKIILPILPLFIAQLGGGGLAVGIISGVSDSLASLAKLFAGRWSDHKGQRKPFVFGGYAFSALAKLLLAFAASWPVVLLLRSAERLGKGLRSAPRDAILAGSTQRHNRGRGFGLHRAMDSGGAVLGTFVALGLYWGLGLGFETIFIVAGVLGFVALLPLLGVHEPAGAAGKPGPVFGGALDPRLKWFLGAASCYGLANFSYMFFVLRAEQVVGGRFSGAIPILLYGLYQVSFTVFAWPAGLLSDRFGRLPVLIGGYFTFVLLCVGFLVARSVPALVALFLLYGLNNALVEANERALVADLAPEHERGTALGFYHIAVSLAALPAGLIAGALWDLEPGWYTFKVGALFALIAALLLVVVRRRVA